MKLRAIRCYCCYLFLFAAAAGAWSGCTAGEEPPRNTPPGMVWIAAVGDQPGFFMDATEVTVAAFAAFVDSTGYVTEAEDFGWSGVFNADSLGWLPVDGAYWRYPQGPDSAAARPDHPVTQLSLRDVRAYADFAGKRIPTAAEWTFAATQSGQPQDYPWGTEMLPPGPFPGNWWQGPFPYQDAVADGFPGVAPVRSFPPAPNGLYDVAGNVWEWTSTVNPTDGQYLIKGGSFLCSTSYCTGFNLRTNQWTPADSGLNHLGMRLVREGKNKEKGIRKKK